MQNILDQYYKTFFRPMLAYKEEPPQGSLTIVCTPLEYLRAPLPSPSDEDSARSQDDAATDTTQGAARRCDSREKATKDNSAPPHGKSAPPPDLLAPALGVLSRLEDPQTADQANAVLEKIQAALPHLPRAAQIKPAVVVGEDGAYLLEWTVGRRRVGISIEKNPSESGWYHVSLDPAAPGSGSGSMKDLDILQLFARLSG
ncbi:MAG: hypothetical protein ACT4QB_17300 [Gammaproteobacteria bacterium]